jgi:hypothetical protein
MKPQQNNNQTAAIRKRTAWHYLAGAFALITFFILFYFSQTQSIVSGQYFVKVLRVLRVFRPLKMMNKLKKLEVYFFLLTKYSTFARLGRDFAFHLATTDI